MATVGNVVKYSQFVPDFFTAILNQTVYTLTNSVGSTGSILVVIDGVKQLANTYSLNGTALTFSEAPASGSLIEITYLGRQGTVNILKASGTGSDSVFYENDKVVTQSYTITSGRNAMVAGPLTINTGVVVSIPTGSTLTIV